MAEPFHTTGEESAGLIGRVFGSRARGAAMREIEALLAAAARVADVSAAEIEATGRTHGVEVSRHLRAPCLSMYRRYLEHCFEDRQLTNAEVQDLAHLREIFCLEAAACASLHDQVALALYGAAVEEALADNRLEPSEEEFLSRLEADLGLDASSARDARAEATRKARSRFIATATAGQGTVVAARELAIELEGSSPESIEAAVSDALAQAASVLPDIEEVEITRQSARLDAGEVRSWHVTLRGQLRRAD